MFHNSLLSWRGLMAGNDRATRRAVICLFALLSTAMVATQTNYFVVGDAHLIAVLAPIAASALLCGASAGIIVGLVAGAAEWVHATLLPLDVYEQYFTVPTNSVLLFGLIGLVMGLLYAGASRRTYAARWQRVAAVLVACLLGSTLFTVLFSVSANMINSLIALEIPDSIMSDLTGNVELFSQAIGNFCLMTAFVLAVAAVWKRMADTHEERTLAQRFQGWLFAVLCAVYLVCAAGTYTAVSVACRSMAEGQLQGQIDYLSGQLTERDELLDSVQFQSHLSPDKAEELHAASVKGLASDLPLGKRGLSVVAENGTIVSSSNRSLVGRDFKEMLSAGLATDLDDTIYDADRSTTWYMEGGELAYMRAAELGYMRLERRGSYEFMAALPQAEVYQWRPIMVAALSGIFLALFAVVYVQASLLLKNVVVKEIDETNETLGLITEGDLDQTVSAGGTVEFAHLSAGINATVGSLKDAIAAEATRNERDLATAKAIQESALPRTFPPFPEIEEFDIYASMNAAREVGGDFYDFFLLDDTNKLAFLIADVSGKGIPASLFMMASKTEIANNIQAGMDLAEALGTANWHLCQGNDADMFVTVWAGILDYETGELTYVNVGHNAPLLRHDGTWRWLKSRGSVVMGMFDIARWRSESITLEPGDQLFLYTDGVNEAFSVTNEQYGDGRLETFLRLNADLHPRALVEGMRAELREWAAGAEQSDDITMLALEYGVMPEATDFRIVDATIDSLQEALAFINEELRNRHCPISVQRRLDVAFEELFVNICRYAYADKDEPGQVRIDYVYSADPCSMTVSLTDWGVPFDPMAHIDPETPKAVAEANVGGLGILMARKSTDDMSYLRDGDANVIAFRKTW